MEFFPSSAASFNQFIKRLPRLLGLVPQWSIKRNYVANCDRAATRFDELHEFSLLSLLLCFSKCAVNPLCLIAAPSRQIARGLHDLAGHALTLWTSRKLSDQGKTCRVPSKLVPSVFSPLV